MSDSQSAAPTGSGGNASNVVTFQITVPQNPVRLPDIPARPQTIPAPKPS